MSVLTDFDKTLMFMHQCLYRVYRSQHVTKWMSSIRLFPYELLMSFRKNILDAVEAEVRLG